MTNVRPLRLIRGDPDDRVGESLLADNPMPERSAYPPTDMLTLFEALAASAGSEGLQQLLQRVSAQAQLPWAALIDERGDCVALVGVSADQLEALDSARLSITWVEQTIGWLLLPVEAATTARRRAIPRLLGMALSVDQAQRKERARTERFRLIAQVSALISTGIDLNTLLERAADAVHERLGYANVDIPLIDPEHPEELVVRIRGGSYKKQIQGEDRIPIAEGIMGAAVRAGRTQRVDNVAADPRYVCPPGVTPAIAELAVPIVHRSEVLGVLNVEGERAFDQDDVVSLEIVAEHLATAILNARLHQSARQSAVIAERQRLARELHDNVTQILSSINLIAQSLAGGWQRDPTEGLRRTDRLQELVRQALVEMRALLRELGPTTQHSGQSKQSQDLVARAQLRREGLASTLERLIRLTTPDTMRTRMDFSGYEAQSVEVEEVLLRVCQEALSNAVRHARARQISVSARVGDNHVELVIADDGRGIDPAAQHGLGLMNMRDRAVELGGVVQILPGSPKGTRVLLKLPRQGTKHIDG